MDFVTAPASHYSLSDLVVLLNRGFEGYFIPIHFTREMFSNMLRKDGIDLTESRVLLADDQPCGVALIAPRPSRRASRVAAMGIARGTRGKGAGSRLMQQLIDDAGERGDHEIVLEAIEQNEPAVNLYRKYGFEPMRRLVGYNYRDEGAKDTESHALSEIDLQKMCGLISQYGLTDLPWQLSGESISLLHPPPRAYRHKEAYAVISNPEAEHVIIWSLLVEPEARGNGLGTKMLRRVMESHPGKTWHVPAVFPEEMGRVFERAGFTREMLTQWQMRREL